MSSPPSEALIQLLSPDGYYTYLGIPKNGSSGSLSSSSSDGSGSGSATNPLNAAAASTVDEDLVKRNYRKLSRKHHPDKPGGDADTFRVLNRAQIVLLNTKLRQQYDILGIDLDDDEEEEEDHAADTNSQTDESTSGEQRQQQNQQKERSSTTGGIVHDIASMVLTGILQLLVRTLMMATLSVLVVRYRWTLYPALLFLAFVAYRIVKMSPSPGIPTEVLSPIFIAAGFVLMHRGRSEMLESSTASEADATTTTTTTTTVWTIWFWLGEALVIGMFMYNSASALPRTPILIAGITVLASLSALWFRGNPWNYGWVLLFQGAMAVFVTLAFPMMELILETILNEKLRKVGDKVRAHHAQLEAFYRAKAKQ